MSQNYDIFQLYYREIFDSPPTDQNGERSVVYELHENLNSKLHINSISNVKYHVLPVCRRAK